MHRKNFLERISLRSYLNLYPHLSFYDIFMNLIKINSFIFVIRLLFFPCVFGRNGGHDLKVAAFRLLQNLSLPVLSLCQGSYSHLLDRAFYALPMFIDQTYTKHH
jgi:hypothetical protein